VSEAGKEIVQVNFRHTEPEYISAYRFYVLQSKELLIRLVVFYVLSSAGLLLILMLMEVGFPFWFPVAACVLVGVAIYGSLSNLPRRHFRDDPRFRDEYHLTCTDSGIEFRTPTINSVVSWSLYTGVIENDKFYILTYGVHAFTLFPKRVFRDGQQETAFRRLLRRHVDHTLKLSAGEREKSEYLPPPFAPPDWR
jgi:hypothetical protein